MGDHLYLEIISSIASIIAFSPCSKWNVLRSILFQFLAGISENVMELQDISPLRPGYSGNHNPVSTEVFPVSPLLWVLLSLHHQSIRFQRHHPSGPISKAKGLYVNSSEFSSNQNDTGPVVNTSKLLEASTEMLGISICLTHIHICCLHIFKNSICARNFPPNQQATWKQWKKPLRILQAKNVELLQRECQLGIIFDSDKIASFWGVINMLLTRPVFTFM